MKYLCLIKHKWTPWETVSEKNNIATERRKCRRCKKVQESTYSTYRGPTYCPFCGAKEDGPGWCCGNC